MKSQILAALLSCGATTAFAQGGAIPDLEGTWISKGKPVAIGTDPHQPGTRALDAPLRPASPSPGRSRSMAASSSAPTPMAPSA